MAKIVYCNWQFMVYTISKFGLEAGSRVAAMAPTNNPQRPAASIDLLL